MGHRRRSDAQRQHDQEKQLVAARTRHPFEKGRNDPRRQIEERDEEGDSGAHSPSDCKQPVRLERAQGGNEHDQDDHRQILHEGDRDHDSPMRRAELTSVEQ